MATAVIGIVSDEFTNPNSVKMLNEVTRQLNARGCLSLLLNVDSREHYLTLLNQAGELGITGLIFLTALYGEETTSIPAIWLSGERALRVDGYAAGEEIGRLLLAQGHQRFGFMHGRETHSQPRQMQGFAASLEAADKTLDQQLVAGNDDRELAYQSMMAYLKKARASERINALFCENDVLAFGAMQAVRDFGQGVHIGVVGFDDVDEARSSGWHLTSWAQRRDLLVAEALNRLLDNRVDNSGAWQQGELQVRHSHHGKHVHGEMSQCGCASRH
ncbi:substrate-binding domain-containing protein [Pantoea phytobeneficialis]|uniref:LacI family transcriptional regulator n=1 Tax=Pantoea phytobeneficialis TaxID=2052056 RepID=A0AAP9H997_9GAMM|nr:substrate-binding domain-containing protein [Pantoea phytobeneficialis]MDO6407184.1 substrate-binding domain-containing protein [Pantoea phytobeneficialis]QGR09155.1 LacI family transcriptional regulator [Pantoea phytobeneficialis]